MEYATEEDDAFQLTITFDELRCFDIEDVASCVSVKSALKICQKSLDELSIKTIEVMSLWLRKLLRGYISDSEYCIEVFKCLYDWLLNLTDDVNSNNKFACSDFIMLLADALSFAEWAKFNLLAAGDRIVHIAAFFLLAVVYSCLQLSNENDVKELEEHEHMAIEIYLIILYLLKEISLSTTQAHGRITPLLRQLVGIADFLNLNLSYRSALVKTGKTMTIICVHYNTVDKSLDAYQAMPNGFQVTALHLCDMGLNQLEVICEKDSTLPMSKLEMDFKFMEVYLIMLHNLFGSGVKHLDKIIWEPLTLLMQRVSQLIPMNEIDNDFSKLIGKYIEPCFLEICELLYQLRGFQKHLIATLSQSKQSIEDYYELCLTFVTISTIQPIELTQFTFHTLQEIFVCLSKNVVNFCNADRYKRILEAFASFLHVSGSAELFNFFCDGVFQKDIIMSQMCADVLMLSFLLEELEFGWSNSGIQRAADFWNKCNNSYAMFSLNPSQWHTQRMVTFFHAMEKKSDPLVPFSLDSFRYLLCIGNEKMLQQRLLLLRLQRLITGEVRNVVQYYEILALMELMATKTIQCLTQISGNMKEMFTREPFQRLANTYFKLALNTSPDTKLEILQTVKPTYEMASNCWYVARFLHDCQNSKNEQLKSLAEQHIHAPFHTLLQILYPGDSGLPRNTDIYEFDYAKLEYNIDQKHVCKQINLKRQHSEHDEGTEMLKQLEQSTQKLIKCAKDLDSTDLRELESIVTGVKNILLKQQK